MASRLQLQNFKAFLLEEISDNGINDQNTLENITDWINSNMDPFEVFEEKELIKWAEYNDYKKEE